MDPSWRGYVDESLDGLRRGKLLRILRPTVPCKSSAKVGRQPSCVASLPPSCCQWQYSLMC